MSAIRLILLNLLLVLGSNAFGAIVPETPANDPIVGRWIYHGKYIATMRPDGTCSYPSGLSGAWRFLRNREAERKYEIIWNGGEYVESLNLSTDGKILDGTNKKGERIRAERTNARSK